MYFLKGMNINDFSVCYNVLHMYPLPPNKLFWKKLQIHVPPLPPPKKNSLRMTKNTPKHNDVQNRPQRKLIMLQ